MHGLPFDWYERDGDSSVLFIDYPDGGRVEAESVLRQALERVEVLAEAAERARLIIHRIPEHLDAAKSDNTALIRLANDLWESESVLQFALTGEEATLEHSEPSNGHIEGNRNVSEENPGG